MTVQLPPDFVMQQMAKIAYEQATESLAAFAEQFAATLTPEISGPAALRAFAAAIRAQNVRQFPRENQQ